MKPRVLFVGRRRYRLPLDESLRAKFDALRERFEVRVLGSAPAGAPTRDDVFTLVPPLRPRALDGAVFRAALPVRIARELVRFRPDAVVAQGPHEAAAAWAGRGLVGSEARVIAEVHGDWRTATRLYGSPARRVLSPVADALGAIGIRRADAVRAVSPYTERLVREQGVEPVATFPAFMDLEPFLARPPEQLPVRPAALFVGVLERYKNVDGLATAWRLAAPRVPAAELRIVGAGPLEGVVQALVRDLPGQTTWRERLSTEEVAGELDRATVLVLPSRSEGMGRIVVEALCRGRGVVATRVGGIPDLVAHEANGLLVDPEDASALADALVRALDGGELAERLATAARKSAAPWLATPEEYAARLHELVVAARG